MFLHFLFFAPRQPLQARTMRFTQAVQTIAAMFPSLQTWKSPTNCCFAWCRCDSLSLRLSGYPSHESTCRGPLRSRPAPFPNLCPPPLLPPRQVWQLPPLPFFSWPLFPWESTEVQSLHCPSSCRSIGICVWFSLSASPSGEEHGRGGLCRQHPSDRLFRLWLQHGDPLLCVHPRTKIGLHELITLCCPESRKAFESKMLLPIS